MPFFLSSMFYISVVDLVLFFYAEYNSALKNILCIFTLIAQFEIDYFLIVYICKLQQPNIRDICVLYHIFRIVGHRLKSGMNEVINMLGYNVT